MPVEDRRGLPNATSASCILLFLARISDEDLRLTRSKILAGPPARPIVCKTYATAAAPPSVAKNFRRLM
jgi:hypothetical protein